MAGGKDETTDRGLFSSMTYGGYGGGHGYSSSHHGGYPPQSYPAAPAYPPAQYGHAQHSSSYSSHGGYPTAGYPVAGGYGSGHHGGAAGYGAHKLSQHGHYSGGGHGTYGGGYSAYGGGYGGHGYGRHGKFSHGKFNHGHGYGGSGHHGLGHHGKFNKWK